jgi:hypothetical protein
MFNRTVAAVTSPSGWIHEVGSRPAQLLHDPHGQVHADAELGSAQTRQLLGTALEDRGECWPRQPLLAPLLVHGGIDSLRVQRSRQSGPASGSAKRPSSVFVAPTKLSGVRPSHRSMKRACWQLVRGFFCMPMSVEGLIGWSLRRSLGARKRVGLPKSGRQRPSSSSPARSAGRRAPDREAHQHRNGGSRMESPFR